MMKYFCSFYRISFRIQMVALILGCVIVSNPAYAAPIDQSSPDKVVVGYIEAIKNDDMEAALSVSSDYFKKELRSDQIDGTIKFRESGFIKGIKVLGSYKVYDVKYFDNNSWANVRIDAGPNAPPMFRGKNSYGFYVEKTGGVWIVGPTPRESDVERIKKWSARAGVASEADAKAEAVKPIDSTLTARVEIDFDSSLILDKNSPIAFVESSYPEDKEFDREIIQKLKKIFKAKGFQVVDGNDATFYCELRYDSKSSLCYEAESHMRGLDGQTRTFPAGSFSHDLKKRLPQMYLGRLSVSILTKAQFNMPREYTHQYGYVRHIKSVIKEKANNYKEIMDYCIIVLANQLEVNEETSSKLIEISANDADLALLR